MTTGEPRDPETVTLLTNDRFISPMERQMLTSRKPVPLTADMLRDMMVAATKRFAQFQFCVLLHMTSDQARIIKHLRVDQQLSWRSVAAECYIDPAFMVWDKRNWAPANNQLMGMALCERAAEILGENAGQPPWN